jgi:hypothetical protein
MASYVPHSFKQVSIRSYTIAEILFHVNPNLDCLAHRTLGATNAKHRGVDHSFRSPSRQPTVEQRGQTCDILASA